MIYNIKPLAENATITIPLKAGGVNEIAWNTLTFIPTASQTVIGNKLTTINGEAIFGKESIIYTLKDSTPTGECDIIQFTVADVAGLVSPISAAYVTFNTLPAPVAANVEVCTTCYESTPFFDVTEFATGDFVKSQTEVITQPVSGVLFQNGSEFSYTQTVNVVDAVDEFTYRLKSQNGIYSNTATVYLKRNCLGNFTNTTVDITCLPKTFNLISLLSNNTYIDAGTWAESTTSYTSQGGTITGANGTVNFTSITPGTYKFTYSGTFTASGLAVNTKNCPVSVTREVTIIHTATPSIAYTTNTNLGGGKYQVNFTVSNVSNPSTITLTNNTNPITTFVVSPQLIGNSGYFVVTLTTGTNNLVISAITKCNTTVTTSLTITV